MVSRQSLPVFGRENPCLKKGQWQLTVAYRGLTSDKHYQGTQPAPQLDAGGPINRQKQLNLELTRAATSRLDLSLSVPLHDNTFTIKRVPPGGRDLVDGITRARGLGDVMARGRYWLLDPHAPARLNLGVTAGVKLPTGKADVTDTIYGRVVPVDWSIQPGDRGLAFSLGSDAFWKVRRATLFASGLYLFNPRDTTGTASFFGALQGRPPVPNSAADQYSVQLGAFLSVRSRWPLPSLSYRIEGVPINDVFGRSNGFRRPGNIQFIEPRLSLPVGRHLVSLGVPIKTHVNVKDSPVSVRREDATVPDAMVLVSYTIGF
ncbi:MAG TPA: hypothetical protein VGQ78_00950 [Vicinamibacteria bacterium]|nr:hypothetical protein [Vicinamibacteria bacterium]